MATCHSLWALEVLWIQPGLHAHLAQVLQILRGCLEEELRLSGETVLERIWIQGYLHISLVDTFELSPDQFVIRYALILERFEMFEDNFDFINVGRLNPEFFVWVAQAIYFYLFNLIHSVLFLLPPT